MEERTVTMQVHIDGADATQWASTVARTTPQTVATRDRLDSNEVMVRLFDLRGAVEAMRGCPASVNMGETRSSRGKILFGNPAGYRGMRFLLVPAR